MSDKVALYSFPTAEGEYPSDEVRRALADGDVVIKVYASDPATGIMRGGLIGVSRWVVVADGATDIFGSELARMVREVVEAVDE